MELKDLTVERIRDAYKNTHITPVIGLGSGPDAGCGLYALCMDLGWKQHSNWSMYEILNWDRADVHQFFYGFDQLDKDLHFIDKDSPYYKRGKEIGDVIFNRG
jgi:hypothetical protein